MNQILRFLAHDRGKPAQIHQERAVTVERDDPSLGQTERHAQCYGGCKAKSPTTQVSVTRMVSVPFRGGAADTHDAQRVPDQIGNFFQTLMPFHGPSYIKVAKEPSTTFSRLHLRLGRSAAQ